jgi:hypothetical protein
MCQLKGRKSGGRRWHAERSHVVRTKRARLWWERRERNCLSRRKRNWSGRDMSMSESRREMEYPLEKRHEPVPGERLVVGGGSGGVVAVFERFLVTKAYQMFVDVCE